MNIKNIRPPYIFIDSLDIMTSMNPGVVVPHQQSPNGGSIQINGQENLLALCPQLAV